MNILLATAIQMANQSEGKHKLLALIFARTLIENDPDPSNIDKYLRPKYSIKVQIDKQITQLEKELKVVGNKLSIPKNTQYK